MLKFHKACVSSPQNFAALAFLSFENEECRCNKEIYSVFLHMKYITNLDVMPKNIDAGSGQETIKVLINVIISNAS